MQSIPRNHGVQLSLTSSVPSFHGYPTAGRSWVGAGYTQTLPAASLFPLYTSSPWHILSLSLIGKYWGASHKYFGCCWCCYKGKCHGWSKINLFSPEVHSAHDLPCSSSRSQCFVVCPLQSKEMMSSLSCINIRFLHFLQQLETKSNIIK